MNATDFRYGFRVVGGKTQSRLIVDADVALKACAACDPRCELERESFLSAFQFSTDFREYLERTRSTKGYAGPCWASWLNFDLDRDGDLPAALEDARRLVVAITDGLGVADDDLLCFLSGGKGFHVSIPAALWAPEPGRDFHRVAKRFAETVAERAGVAIDTGIYDRVRCFRAPNSRHPRTGLHKRWLSGREVMGLNIDTILAMAKHPEPFELPAPAYKSKPAATLWAESAERVKHEADAAATRRAAVADGQAEAKLNQATMAFIRDGAAPGGNGLDADRAAGAGRHRLCYSAAANLSEFGAPLRLCSALLTESALDSGLSPGDVRKAIRNGWQSVNAVGEPPEGGAS